MKREAKKKRPPILDVGFRVLKLDSSNMKDEFYASAQDLRQDDLFGIVDRIKPDRTAEDLLFQVMIDLGFLLSSPIDRDGDLFFIPGEGGGLLACFEAISAYRVVGMAMRCPCHAVFRESKLTDADMANIHSLFSIFSPGTTIHTL